MPASDSYVDLNLNGNELQNVCGQNLPSTPPNVKESQFWYDSANHTMKFYNGSTDVDMGAQGRIYTEGTGIDISSGGVISVDFSDVATASQGTKADTALQPNDNISELTNNAGYITGITDTMVITALGYTPVNPTALNSYVPTSRTINGKALSANISLTASDVGALPSTTTINDLTTTAQQNALNSGATTTNIGQIATNTSAISTINSKIPSEASSSNQLADKAFVNSTVQTNTANFRGNWATWAAVPSSANDYPADYTGSKTPTVNDYLVVQDASDYTGSTLTGTWRFKYSGVWGTDGKSGWLPEYQVNETPLTQAQLDALNSGITSALVTQIGTNQSNISSLQGAMLKYEVISNPALTPSGGVITWTVSINNGGSFTNVFSLVVTNSSGNSVIINQNQNVVKFNSATNVSANSLSAHVIYI